MNISRTAGIKLAAIAAFMLASSLGMAPLAQAKKDAPEDKNWSDWSAIGAGYVARRREPARMELPPSKRRLAGTQAHSNSKKSKAENDKNNDKNTLAQSAGKGDGAPAFDRLWFYTTEEGLHSVSIPELALQSGKTEKKIRKNAKQGELSLSNNDQPIAWYFDEKADSIWFAASAYDSFYTDADAYHFSMKGKSSLSMAPGKRKAPTSSGRDTPFVDTLHFEEEPDFYFDTSSMAAKPESDYWFWDYLWGGYQDSIDISLRVPSPASQGTAQLRIALQGWTDLEAGNDHTVSARLNGIDIGSSVSWDGFDAAELVVEFDQGLLEPSGTNTLTLYTSYTPGTHPGQWLDSIDIKYSRMPTADNGSLWLHQVRAGTQSVRGFNSENLVVIESPRGKAVLRSDALIKADGPGSWSVTFATTKGADYLVAERGSAYAPTVAPDYSSSLGKRKNAADYLIIAPREFALTAQALADYRGNRFSQVKVVWLDDIYDEFSAGRDDPAAITAFMRRVQDHWQLSPSIVTIIGKGSLDHKNRMGYDDSFVPVRLVSTPWSLAPSDDRLLDMDYGDGFAIGRLPITNDQEGVAYVEKLIDHEFGAYNDERYRAVLVADNPDEAGDFHANSNLLAEQLLDTAGFEQVTKLYHPGNAVRTELILSSTWEKGYLSYDGHGASSQLGNGRENFINKTDANLLTNSVLPVFTALTCASGDDSMPGERSLASALVLNPGGGAIASLAPTGLSLDVDAQILGTAFVDSLFTQMNTLGDAVLDAKAQTEGYVSDFIPRIYSVVGDPAIFAR